MALQIVVPLFFIVPFIMQRGLNPSSPDFGREAAEILVTDRTALLLQVISLLPIHLLTVVLIWAVVTRFGKRPFFASFGWHLARGVPEAVALVGIGVTLFFVSALVASLIGATQETQMEQLIKSSLAARYMIAVLAVFTAPFVEEFVYRGIVYSALQRTIGVRAAVVLVALLFTLIHVPQYRQSLGVIVAVAMLSVALTLARAYSGRLLPSVIIHMAFNAVQAAMLVLAPFFTHVPPPAEPTAPTTSLFLPLVHLIFWK